MQLSFPDISRFAIQSRAIPPRLGQEKNNKHKHFGRDGVRDKQEPSLGQTGPLPGTNWDLSLGQAGFFLFKSTVKSPFCPVCPWDGWGFVPGTIVPQGPSEKCLCVFCLLVIFGPPKTPAQHVIPRSLESPFVLLHLSHDRGGPISPGTLSLQSLI